MYPPAGIPKDMVEPTIGGSDYWANKVRMQYRKTNPEQASEQFRTCLYTLVCVVFFPSHLFSSPFFCLSFLVVTQIRGQISGSSPSSPLLFVPCILITRRFQLFPRQLASNFVRVLIIYIFFERIEFLIATSTVSYTHLRAHETREDLVCRLLLEKKNK